MNRATKIVFVLALLILSACATFSRSVYSYNLDSESAMADNAGRLTITSLEKNQLMFSFQNVGQSTAKIIWDETSLVDTDGQSHRVIHGETKLIASGQSQPPTSVPRGAAINDGVTYADGIDNYGGTWVLPEIVKCSSIGALCNKKQYFGKSVTLSLAVDVEGKRHEYTAKLVLKPAESAAVASK